MRRLLTGLVLGALVTPIAHLITATVLGRSWIYPTQETSWLPPTR